MVSSPGSQTLVSLQCYLPAVRRHPAAATHWRKDHTQPAAEAASARSNRDLRRALSLASPTAPAAAPESEPHVSKPLDSPASASLCSSKAAPSATAYSEDEQVALLETAIENLLKAGGASPMAFRAGDYAANNATLRALRRVGLLVSGGGLAKIDTKELLSKLRSGHWKCRRRFRC